MTMHDKEISLMLDIHIYYQSWCLWPLFPTFYIFWSYERGLFTSFLYVGFLSSLELCKRPIYSLVLLC